MEDRSEKEKETLPVKIDPDQHRALLDEARLRGSSIEVIVRQALSEFLNRKSPVLALAFVGLYFS